MEASSTINWREIVAKVQAQVAPEGIGGLDRATEDWESYSPLVHILRGFLQQEAEVCFQASVFAPNRSLFRRRLLGEPPNRSSPLPMLAPYVTSAPEQPSDVSDSSPRPSSTTAPVPTHKTPPPAAPVSEPVLQSPLPNYHLLPLVRHAWSPSSVEQVDVFAPLCRQQLRPSAAHPLAGYLQADQALLGIPASDKAPTAKATEIIDRFLADPSKAAAPTPAVEGTIPHPAAQASLEPDGTVITETLARLHIRQNHPEEAIRIYRQLCLRYPEKKAYFEAQIEQLTQSS